MGMDSDKAAYMAYSNVLKPYHGWMTEKVVGNAVSYGPAREKIFEYMKITAEEMLEQCPPFCDELDKLTEEVKAMLKANQAHFEDKM